MRSHDQIKRLKRLMRKHGMSPSPHFRIVEASYRGTGIRLSAKEVLELANDEAIWGAAENDLIDDLEEAGQSLDDIFGPQNLDDEQ